MRRLLLGLFSAWEAWRIPDREVARLRSDFPDLEIVRASSKEELGAAIEHAEIAFSWAPGEEVVSRAERLRWLHSPAAGIGSYLTPSLTGRGILLTNSRGVHAVPIAEHTMGMLVGLTRRCHAAVADQIAGGMQRDRWFEGPGIPRELCGGTLGLFGYGAIGREVARRAAAFGMRVVAVRRRPHQPPPWDPDLLRALGLPEDEPSVDLVLGPDELGRMLEQSDAVVVAAALTLETQGIFDSRAFARMKRGALFVNVARGKIAREHDLAEALRGGQLGGAALDVFEIEPLPRRSELYTLENVILTPHVSGNSAGFWPRAMALFRENLRRDAAGIPLLNRVDIERGY